MIMLLPTMDKAMHTAHKNGHTLISPETVLTAIRPDPQVTQRATRRRFTAADKLRILAEADACNQPGQLGALLRCEGLYSSSLASFRKQRDEGKLGKDPNQMRQQRRDKEAARQRDARKIAHLEAENKRLNILLDLQKKVAELLSLPLESQSDG
jgi:transposase-like protein